MRLNDLNIRLEKGKGCIALALVWAVAAFGAQVYAGLWEGAAILPALVMAGLFGAAAFASAVIRVELKSWWSAIAGLLFAALSGCI